MALVDLVMPKMGESIMEATILRWNKQTGDTVKMDETVLEIATDKVDSEVPSTAEGVLEEILFNVNDVVPVGTVIARIRSAGSAAASAPAATVQAPAQRNPNIQTTSVVEEVPYQPAGATTPRPAGGVRFYSP
ncbi:MAG: 2-oxo acid dehydrogenase subunit E2, partial [Bacteroidetes bacterium]|nr:2-oxo acid dehydrogenase subunit E2 [Bacteroidota bacterium]